MVWWEEKNYPHVFFVKSTSQKSSWKWFHEKISKDIRIYFRFLYDMSLIFFLHQVIILYDSLGKLEKKWLMAVKEKVKINYFRPIFDRNHIKLRSHTFGTFQTHHTEGSLIYYCQQSIYCITIWLKGTNYLIVIKYTYYCGWMNIF